MTISRFIGPHRWLSNFYACPISRNGVEFASVEHAYQAAKSIDPAVWRLFSARDGSGMSAGQAKRAGRSIAMRSDWTEVRVVVMAELIEQKFAREPFRSQLLSTGDQDIIEGNDWGDRFWGVDLRTGTGENMLGRLIMLAREQIRAKFL